MDKIKDCAAPNLEKASTNDTDSLSSQEINSKSLESKGKASTQADFSKDKKHISALSLLNMYWKGSADFKQSDFARARDQYTYVFGCILTYVTVYLLAAYPKSLYFHWLVGIEIVLYIKRLIYYKSLNWHYFCIDYCYAGNLAMCLMLVFFRDSEWLYLAAYASCTGGIALGIVAFKDSIVFHNMDKTHNVVIHLLPMVTFWNIHWSLRTDPEMESLGFPNYENCELSWAFVRNYYFSLFTYYSTWCIIYYTLTYLVMIPQIKKNGGLCLVSFEIGRDKIFLNKVLKRYGFNAAFVCFILKHALVVYLGALISLPGFFYRTYYIIFMVFYTVLSIKNGADYYILYFANKYEILLEELDEPKESDAGKVE